MYSTIIEITTQPIESTDYLSEDSFYEHWFVNQIADSVDDRINREEFLHNFKTWFEENQLGHYNASNHSFSIGVKGKEKYFSEKFENFQKSLNKLAAINLIDFATGSNQVASTIYELSSSFSEEYRSYVVLDKCNGIEPIPFDDFIREVEVGKPYFIGGVLRYHF